MLLYLRKRTRGEWNYRELGENFRLVESDDKNILYMGVGGEEIAGTFLPANDGAPT
ncbi:MAG TPA: hypothetical protein VGM64_05285 [Lacunisphaera sp.]|jgi:hypothetical protein